MDNPLKLDDAMLKLGVELDNMVTLHARKEFGEKANFSYYLQSFEPAKEGPCHKFSYRIHNLDGPGTFDLVFTLKDTEPQVTEFPTAIVTIVPVEKK